jgi:hypothetical protein
LNHRGGGPDGGRDGVGMSGRDGGLCGRGGHAVGRGRDEAGWRADAGLGCQGMGGEGDGYREEREEHRGEETGSRRLVHIEDRTLGEPGRSPGAGCWFQSNAPHAGWGGKNGCGWGAMAGWGGRGWVVLDWAWFRSGFVSDEA